MKAETDEGAHSDFEFDSEEEAEYNAEQVEYEQVYELGYVLRRIAVQAYQWLI